MRKSKVWRKAGLTKQIILLATAIGIGLGASSTVASATDRLDVVDQLSFMVETTGANQTVEFTLTGTASSGGNFAMISWGDGTVRLENSGTTDGVWKPRHTFANAGSYNIIVATASSGTYAWLEDFHGLTSQSAGRITSFLKFTEAISSLSKMANQVTFAIETTRPNQTVTFRVSGRADANGNNAKISWGETPRLMETYTNIAASGSWNPSHTYARPGYYLIDFAAPASGPGAWLTGFHGMTPESAETLVEIASWGSVLTSLSEAGALAVNLERMPDYLPPNVTNLSNMLYGANGFNDGLNDWDVSKVRDMSSMFRGAINFNQPLNNWNVSSVRNMAGMFDDARKFNQSLNSWNVSNVTNMDRMFRSALAFNQPLSGWAVNYVTSMSEMFHLAAQFNQPLNAWNVRSVRNMDLMFRGATAFNQDISGWQPMSARNFYHMFNLSGLDGIRYMSAIKAWSASITATDVQGIGAGMVYFDNDAQFAQVVDKLSNVWRWSNWGHSLGYQVTVDPNYPGVKSESAYAVKAGTNFVMPAAPTAPAANYRFRAWSTAGVTYAPGAALAISNRGYKVHATWDKLTAENDKLLVEYTITTSASNKELTLGGICDIYQIGSALTTFHWGDGAFDQLSCSSDGNLWISHTYASEGTFSVAVSTPGGIDYPWASLPSVRGNSTPLLRSVDYWSDEVSLAYFQSGGAVNLTAVPRYLPTHNRSGHSLFLGASSFNQSLADWDMERVRWTNSMFEGATSFNQDLSSWNLVDLGYANKMFKGATSFNQDISGWNVAGILAMDEFLANSGIDATNLSRALVSLAANSPLNGVTDFATGRMYSTSVPGVQEAVNTLTSPNRGWILGSSPAVRIFFQTGGIAAEVPPIWRAANSTTVLPVIPDTDTSIFLGWIYTNRLVASGEEFTVPADESIVLVAMFQIGTRATVTFEEIEGFGTPPALNVVTGRNFIVPGAGGLARPGYELAGWVINGTLYQLGTTFENAPAEVTLRPYWLQMTVRMSFDSNGGTAVAARTIAANAVLTSLPTPRKAGFTFKGWSLGNSRSIVSLPFRPNTTRNFTLSANWEKK